MAKVVAPKKEKLAAAEAEYSELIAGLSQKKAELAEVEASLAALNAKLKEMQVCTAGLCCDPVRSSLRLLRPLAGPDTLAMPLCSNGKAPDSAWLLSPTTQPQQELQRDLDLGSRTSHVLWPTLPGAPDLEPAAAARAQLEPMQQTQSKALHLHYPALAFAKAQTGV